jgi:hypothetical protein
MFWTIVGAILTSVVIFFIIVFTVAAIIGVIGAMID